MFASAPVWTLQGNVLPQLQPDLKDKVRPESRTVVVSSLMVRLRVVASMIGVSVQWSSQDDNRVSPLIIHESRRII